MNLLMCRQELMQPVKISPYWKIIKNLEICQDRRTHSQKVILPQRRDLEGA